MVSFLWLPNHFNANKTMTNNHSLLAFNLGLIHGYYGDKTNNGVMWSPRNGKM